LLVHPEEALQDGDRDRYQYAGGPIIGQKVGRPARRQPHQFTQKPGRPEIMFWRLAMKALRVEVMPLNTVATIFRTGENTIRRGRNRGSDDAEAVKTRRCSVRDDLWKRMASPSAL